MITPSVIQNQNMLENGVAVFECITNSERWAGKLIFFLGNVKKFKEDVVKNSLDRNMKDCTVCRTGILRLNVL
jgi:hypothetical protein